MMPHNIASTLKSYREEKLEVLQDFYITITSEIENEINARTSESEIDHYCHDLIRNHLDNY